MNCGVGCRCTSDLALLWLWRCCRPAATALIRPLAWEPPHATGLALEKAKRPKKKKKEREIGYFAFCLREVPENSLYVSLVVIVVQIQQGKDINILHSAWYIITPYM